MMHKLLLLTSGDCVTTHGLPICCYMLKIVASYVHLEIVCCYCSLLLSCYVVIGIVGTYYAFSFVSDSVVLVSCHSSVVVTQRFTCSTHRAVQNGKYTDAKRKCVSFRVGANIFFFKLRMSNAAGLHMHFMH